MKVKDVMSYPEIFWQQSEAEQIREYVDDVFININVKIHRTIKEYAIIVNLSERGVKSISEQEISDICSNLDLIRIRGNKIKLIISNGSDIKEYNVKNTLEDILKCSNSSRKIVKYIKDGEERFRYETDEELRNRLLE